ncbi:aminotransferase class III-fold pyridoxal phosphate-dependent enzyme [Novosphingobium sp. SG707]|uniref:aspartate aminotransferase family protein n=1 Tax=Novosphingobium sp. SG707 TaxID=2586996 RepID=UPI001445E04F|nr:aminotransferase class III-fold pyridoxal phosphate-dependent enzyme [Novosphingobium sp. SG707]NKJ02832.1 4-aminobutyrate aminotransferase-like enzyme [Novosphingobium sp. SG707]
MSVVDLSSVNAFIPGQVELDPHEAHMVEQRTRLLGPAYRLMYQKPLHFVRGEGVWLYDADGRRYLDTYNNVVSLGHCHPDVVEAITRQVATLCTNTRYLHETILELAEGLLSTVQSDLSHMMLTCSGSEANDLAYRIAKARTGGTGVIITETAYHGITDAVSQFSPTLGAAVPLGAHVRTVAAPAAYRSGPHVVERFTRDVEAAIADLKRHGIQPAMLIVDSIFTSDGILSEEPGFLKGAVEAIRRAGGIFVADEVQPGFGRTGSHMWGFQRHGVDPDIVTLGKPMGNGQPIAGLLTRHDVVEKFGNNSRYFNTFAGNAVSCAAAAAVLKVIRRDRIMDNARDVGAYLLERVSALRSRHECLGHVRGAGLFVAADIVSNRETQANDRARTTRVVNAMRDNGVLISACGTDHNILKIRPPLVFSRENVDLFVEVLDEALAV